MLKFFIATVFLLFIAHLLYAQIMPAEGSKLNYRLIGFKFPPEPHAGNYKIEIATSNCNTEDSFKKHIIETFAVKKNKIIAEVPSFGAQYTWRYNYSVKGALTPIAVSAV